MCRWPTSGGRCFERIRKTSCCTHLNDALRALAEVPVLAATLTGA
ncbi:MAG TPA: hypothetical protein VFI47_06755 [Acidimicrobiales bacterium]|nr:hypothetical protein [Acidimicrobiales bacterium]